MSCQRRPREQAVLGGAKGAPTVTDHAGQHIRSSGTRCHSTVHMKVACCGPRHAAQPGVNPPYQRQRNA